MSELFDKSLQQSLGQHAFSVCLMEADKGLPAQPHHARSELTQSEIRSFGIPPHARLLYRPQPAISQQSDWAFRSMVLAGKTDSHDLSFRYLCEDLKMTVLGVFHYNAWLEDLDYESSIHFLTFLDAFNVTPPERHTEAMTCRVEAINSIFQELYKFRVKNWDQTSGKVQDRLEQCALYLTLQRLDLYFSRSRACTFRELTIEIASTRGCFKIPDKFDVGKELKALALICEDEEARVIDLFKEKVKLRWAGDPIAMSQFTEPMNENDPNTHCVICAEAATASGLLTKLCKHAYCQGCLEAWVLACEPNSHTCPSCRTELFPKPTYVYKKPDIAINYQRELEKVRKQEDQIIALRDSNAWLIEELKLQELFDTEVTSKMASST
jgi:hypothetical protein